MKVDIEFDKPSREYYAGDKLEGVVLITPKKPMRIKDIQLLVKGKGVVRWTETSGSGDDQTSTTYSSNEIYLDKLIDIPTSSVYTTGDGSVRFPFSVNLPSDLPESFDSPSGKVKYKAKCTVRSFTSKKTEEFPFTVHALLQVPISLNELVTVEGNKNIRCCSECCCCCWTGTVSVRMVTDKGGYLPDEPINFNVDIYNRSSSEMGSVTLRIIQKTVCIANGGNTTTSQKKIDPKFIYHGILHSRDSLVWSKTVTIPSGYPPTNLGTCKIINVNYFLELRIGEDSGVCSPDVHFRIPIMLGSAALSSRSPALFQSSLENVYPPVVTQQPSSIAKVHR